MNYVVETLAQGQVSSIPLLCIPRSGGKPQNMFCSMNSVLRLNTISQSCKIPLWLLQWRG